MLCPACSNANDQDATFCAFCGASISPLPLRPAVAVAGNVGAGAVVSPILAPPNLGTYAPSTPEVEGLGFDRYVSMLCRDQSFLTQLAIRFYYITGLKSYLVTHHDSFVVPNLRMDAAEIYSRIKADMDGLGYEELFTTYLRMKTEHIQTLPYLSRSVVPDRADVQHNYSFFGALVGGLRLYFEIVFGIIFLIADLFRLIGRSITQGIGLSVRIPGREGLDELLSGTRLILASTYRHTRTYTYIRDVGPETYVGWFTHHEPLPGTGVFLAIGIVFIFFAWLTGVYTSLPLVFLFGVIGGLAYTFWFAPWFLHKVGALPQPRYLSAMVFALMVPGWLVGFNMLDQIASGRFLSPRFYAPHVSDPFSVMLIIASLTANYALFWIGIVVFIRAVMLSISHFDEFDVETHSKIVKERIGLILGQLLESSGYTAAEATEILQQNMPGAGRYRRSRS